MGKRIGITIRAAATDLTTTVDAVRQADAPVALVNNAHIPRAAIIPMDVLVLIEKVGGLDEARKILSTAIRMAAAMASEEA
jgi:hypothetical protein